MRRLEGALRSWCQTIQGDGGCCTSIHVNDHAIRVIVTDSSPGELQSHLANLDVELSRNWDRKQKASAASASGAGVNTS
jgi:hypothetical protein